MSYLRPYLFCTYRASVCVKHNGPQNIWTGFVYVVQQILRQKSRNSNVHSYYSIIFSYMHSQQSSPGKMLSTAPIPLASMGKVCTYILYFITARTQEKHLKIYSKRRSCFFFVSHWLCWLLRTENRPMENATKRLACIYTHTHAHTLVVDAN